MTDLLVSDAVVPNLGGRQLAERLTAVKPGLKVLFLSGTPTTPWVATGF